MNILEMSLSGAVFIIAILMVRAVFLNRLPKKTFLILWEIVLLRLLLPFTVSSVFSVYTFINHTTSTSFMDRTRTDSIVSAIAQEHLVPMPGAEQPPASSPSVSVWFVLWCAGMILCASFFVMTYLRCRIEFQTALPVHNAYAAHWLQERAPKRKLSVRQSDKISTPLTYGVLHPVILMPKNTDWENTNALQYILSHEYVHIERFDAITKLVAIGALCVHWFNPFVWAMYIFFNRDLELSCDERIVRQFGENSKSTYSRILIRMEAKKSGLAPLISNFSRNASEERITAIMTTRKTTPVMAAASCLIVFVTAGLFATSAIASTDHSAADTTAAINPISITHESADILYYDDGCPYVHDILTNNTGKTITETQYCMLAYDKNGLPLKLCWNFLDSSAPSSFENIVQSSENILPNQTEQYRGGWSLYDGEKMADLPKVGDGRANQAAYILICLKQVSFDDDTVWENPDYEAWVQTYAGKETRIEELHDYYPHTYQILFQN
ncbi:MAG: M56 family metallopeptidase [Lachnospiraceae bacterium]|nr:M56 family metallopeptidase [Lachnospiraceae bacterium]